MLKHALLVRVVVGHVLFARFEGRGVIDGRWRRRRLRLSRGGVHSHHRRYGNGEPAHGYGYFASEVVFIYRKHLFLPVGRK